MQWQVDESKRSSSGGGLVDHGELIEVLSVPLDNTGAFLMDPSLNSSPGLMYGLLWARDEINAGRVSKMYGLPETTLGFPSHRDSSRNGNSRKLPGHPASAASDLALLSSLPRCLSLQRSLAVQVTVTPTHWLQGTCN